jgi:2-keto-4-pentenoate hydratase/2-oxohepta-3-ene-1,7-dioic acid hydratase in catechol pathway
VQLEHNGESALNQPLSDMILKPTELIQLLSKYFTLDPGDLILTGTPTKPKLPPRLKTGDTIIASVGPGIRVETNVV